MDEYVGPGERKTAERLASDLPESWVIYVGRKLAGPNKDDVDFIVVGQKLIFAIEEKHWGPTIVVDDVFWYVKGERRHSPVSQVAAVSRKLAGLLRDKVNGYAALKGKRVLASVVLSYDGVNVQSGRNFDHGERVWTLPHAAEEMIALEQREPAALGATRPVLLQYLDGLSPAEKRDRIGDYKVIGQIPAAGNEKAYEARAPITGETVILKCYSIEQLNQLGDPREYLLREYKAINAVADLGRTWRALEPFESAPHGYFVVPVIPPANSWTLWRDVQSLTTPREDGIIGVEDATMVARNAFEALKDVHDAGLVHRALHPQRIWLSKNRLVKFSDFHLAKITGQQTIYTWADYDISEGYRAPESAGDVGLATAPSDVYSLALSLAAWLLGSDVTGMRLDDVRTALTGVYPWSEALIEGLDGTASNRSTASEMAERIVLPALSPPPLTGDSLDDFRVDGLVGSRYKILDSLGSGGFAQTWKVYDKNAELTRVLKQFHELIPDHVRTEFQAADKLVHEKCGRVYDIQLAHAPAYLVSEYVEGESLAEPGIDRSVAEIRSTALDVLDALEYIHGKERVHGDVTPSNIIEESNGSGSAKLIDFGLSSAIGRRPTGWNPLFAAPEVRRDDRVTPAADIFGFAASMAYAMLGRHAITVDGDQVRPLPPTDDERETWGDEGALLLDVFFKGLAARPDQRPESANAFRALVNGARLVPSAVVPPSTVVGSRNGKPVAQIDLAPRINPNVSAIRRLYRGATGGNGGNRGLDDEFASDTYVATRLDERLVPRVLAKEFDVVLLSGNPGDGKTSVLVKLGAELRARGATDIDSDEAGWTLELEGHRFYAIFDASESHGEMSSDDLVNRALFPVLEGEPATALLAVNDGRLNQFFIDNSHLYEQWWFSIEDQMNGKPYDGSGAVLIDLKRRTLAATGLDAGLGPCVLDTLVADSLWEECHSCTAQTSCPILANRNLLASDGAATFSELLQISHLRRRRRATFRDIRSAISWILTGNMTCEDVHELIDDGQNPLYRESSAAFDLAFSEDSGDYLVQEWAGLDPASVPAPAVDRAFRALKDDAEVAYLSNPEHLARAIYFRLSTVESDEVDPSDLRTFRYLDEFTAMLKGVGATETCDRVLLGISRLAGAFGYSDPGLAMSSGADGATWAVLHTVPAGEFHVEVPTIDGEFVETMPDQLLLKHENGASLNLTLDTAEIILRAADGEIVNDIGADATRQEIDSFVNQLKRRPSQSAQIVDSSGSVTLARIRGTAIEMESAQ